MTYLNIMIKAMNWFLILTFLYAGYSCEKAKNYFRDLDTEVVRETLQTNLLTGYAASKAMAVIEGHTFPNVTVFRSNQGFPCTTTMIMDMTQDPNLMVASEKASTITIAGLWPDTNTAILTLLFTDFQSGTNIIELIGMETIPVIRYEGSIRVALANMDISLNPDQESILSLNLTTLEIESELLRLEMPRPADVYAAIKQDAYFIDVDYRGTLESAEDDQYTITGGGQLVEVNGNSAEIVQMAMVGVSMSPDCLINPLSGMALMKVTGVESERFPELGTVLLQFNPSCDGKASVFVATGMYIGANGKHLSFHL
jgi:hypothetical protein